MLEDIKKYLRINHDESDDEIEDLINACIKDLELSGVASSNLPTDAEDTGEVDTSIKRAITIYCKAHFGYDNPDYEKLIASYKSLKDHLCISTDYGTVIEEEADE